QVPGDGGHRPVRTLLGNILRPWRGDPGRAARQPRSGRRPLYRDLESRLHAVRAAAGRRSPAVAAAVDRYRHGARTHCRRPPGQARQLRYRPVPRVDHGLGRGLRGCARPAACGVAPGHRRSSARFVVPDRRRRAAQQGGPRLCAAPDHAARDAARASARLQGPADVAPGPGAGAADGRRFSRIAARSAADRRDAAVRTRDGEARQRSRASWVGSGEAATETAWFALRDELGATEFLGYETETAEGVILALVKGEERVPEAQSGEGIGLIVNQTPFYGEAGGQVGDTGAIFSATGGEFAVSDTQRKAGDSF